MSRARRRRSWSRHPCMIASASGVLKSSSSAAAKRSHSPSAPARTGSGRPRGSSRRAPPLRPASPREKSIGLRQWPVRKKTRSVSRPIAVERVAHRHDVPDRLGHLLVGELEHSVVHPDPGELPPERARLRDLVLVVGKDEVEPAPVDLEDGAEQLLGHHRALDVPAGPAATPRRVPGGVLARLVRLPEREVARVLLERVRLLLLDLVRPLARQAAVLGKARDPEVDVALDRVRVVPSRPAAR